MANEPDLMDLLQETRLPSVALLVRFVKQLELLAWDECAEARVRGDDATATERNGRARALCQVLGDQARMGPLLDQVDRVTDEPDYEGPVTVLVTKYREVIDDNGTRRVRLVDPPAR